MVQAELQFGKAQAKRASASLEVSEFTTQASLQVPQKEARRVDALPKTDNCWLI